jgi:phosphate-selective porin
MQLASTSYDRHRSEHIGFGGRAAFAPFQRRRTVIQLGGSAEYRDVFGDQSWRITSRPESIWLGDSSARP